MFPRKFLFPGIIVLILFIETVLLAIVPENRVNIQNKLEKPLSLEYKWYNANNINTWFGNNGEIISYNPTGNAGMYYPAGSGLTVGFQSGIWFAGKVNGEIRTACADYSSEFQPGSILYDPAADNPSPGVPQDYQNPLFQIYSIQRGDGADPAAKNYNWEYANWPVEYGAPAHDGEYFTDENGNGLYDSGENFEDYNLNGIWDAPDGIITKGQDPPLWLGDQVHWCVYNDFDPAAHTRVFKTDPLGIEVQQTMFGFSDNGPLNNVMFVKFLIINKSGQTIDSLYWGNWFDDDIGDASDDYVGCDTLYNIGYTYNGHTTDANYGVEVPCKATCILQGPIVPDAGNVAYISGRELADYRNLPMTAFPRIKKSSREFDDPEFPEEVYNVFRGLSTVGKLIINPITNKATTYALSGDPVTGNGWDEQDDEPPYDRRALISSGPFDLPTWTDKNNDNIPQPGEPGVQEIVMAIIVGQGTDHLNSIAVMRYFAGYTQTFWHNNLQVPRLVTPVLESTEHDGEIILSWQSSATDVEQALPPGYSFEGYTLYQGKSPEGPWYPVNSFDIKNEYATVSNLYYDPNTKLLTKRVIHQGKNSGISYSSTIHTDYFTNEPIINNRSYYFGLKAYAYNPARIPAVIESPISTITARPHLPPLGQEIVHAAGDTIPVDYQNTKSDAKIHVTVINPDKLDGSVYALRLREDRSRTRKIKIPIWGGTETVTSSAVWCFGRIDPALPLQPMIDTIVTPKYIYRGYPDTRFTVNDGFEVSIRELAGAPTFLPASIEQTVNIESSRIDSVTYPLLSHAGVDSLYLVGNDTMNFHTTVHLEHQWDWYRIITLNNDDYVRLYRVIPNEIFIAELFFFRASVTGMGGGSTDTNRYAHDIELRFTENGSKAIRWSHEEFIPSLDTIPFEVWDIEQNQQITIGYWDINDNNTLHHDSTKTLDKDWLIFLFSDYDNGNGVYIDGNPANGLQPMSDNPNSSWLTFFDDKSVRDLYNFEWSEYGYNDLPSKYTIGDVVKIHFTNPVDPTADEFRFTALGLDSALSKAVLKNQLKRINVFPNPYFGYNAEETTEGENFVTFTNLPEKDAIIRIFSLGGQLVRKLEHNNATPFENWDLKNDYSRKVASGIYIAHIEVKDVGAKILKMAVFMPK